jgi:hypothetical protein
MGSTPIRSIQITPGHTTRGSSGCRAQGLASTGNVSDRRGFWFGASPAAVERLPLRALADPKRQPDRCPQCLTSALWFVFAAVWLETPGGRVAYELSDDAGVARARPRSA